MVSFLKYPSFSCGNVVNKTDTFSFFFLRPSYDYEDFDASYVNVTAKGRLGKKMPTKWQKAGMGQHAGANKKKNNEDRYKFASSIKLSVYCMFLSTSYDTTLLV